MQRKASAFFKQHRSSLEKIQDCPYTPLVSGLYRRVVTLSCEKSQFLPITPISHHLALEWSALFGAFLRAHPPLYRVFSKAPATHWMLCWYGKDQQDPKGSLDLLIDWADAASAPQGDFPYVEDLWIWKPGAG